MGSKNRWPTERIPRNITPSQQEAFDKLNSIRRSLPRGHHGFSTQFSGGIEAKAKMAVDSPEGRYWVEVSVPNRQHEAADAWVASLPKRRAVRPLPYLNIAPEPPRPHSDLDDTIGSMAPDEFSSFIDGLSPEELADMVAAMDSEYESRSSWQGLPGFEG